MLIDHKLLKHVLSLLRQVVPSGNSLPQYKAVLFDPSAGDTLAVSATSGDVFLKMILPITQDPKKPMDQPFSLNADKLGAVVNNLPIKGELKFKANKKSMVIGVADDAFNLPLGVVEDIPAFPHEGFEPYVTADGLELSQAYLRTFKFCLEEKDGPSRSTLHGPSMNLVESELRVYGTDGYVMGKNVLSVDVDQANANRILVPKSTPKLLQGIVSTLADPKVTVCLNSSYLLYQNAGFQLAVRRVEGKAPDCEKIIPASQLYSFTMSNGRLKELLRVATALEKEAHVVLEFIDENTITVQMEQEQAGASRSKINYQGQRPPFTIRLNPNYLNKLASSVHGEDIRIGCNTAESPLFAYDGPHHLYMIMPSKLK